MIHGPSTSRTMDVGIRNGRRRVTLKSRVGNDAVLTRCLWLLFSVLKGSKFGPWTLDLGPCRCMRDIYLHFAKGLIILT
jgi:hypothetical protein